MKTASENELRVPEDAAPVALCPCGRRRPETATGYWTPSEAAIAALERALPDAVTAHGDHVALLRSSRRQYLGVVRENERVIHVNVFPKSPGTSWRSIVVRKCVWDKRFLGAEYNVQLGRFTYIAFQGQA